MSWNIKFPEYPEVFWVDQGKPGKFSATVAGVEAQILAGHTSVTN
jgi:hypothetical protein